ncbi:MAG: hypothetical protein KAX30_04780 [Candidatus Atribacteria bacterium]|nr:hypothetical protein [Candidatus Atribacteria bacterium]
MGFSDRETETARQFRTYFDEIRGLTERLEALPSGSEYRLVLDLDANAPAVNGWQQTELKDMGHLERWHRGERDVIETGLINVGMEYRGRAYRGWNISEIPGRYENRIFIGGNYRFMVNLREIEMYVRENGFQPILACDFNMPRSKIYEHSLLLLHNCKYAIFDVTSPAGELMEIQMTKYYGTTVLLVHKMDSRPSSMVTTFGHPMRGYSGFDELRWITAQWFTGIKGGSV